MSVPADADHLRRRLARTLATAAAVLFLTLAALGLSAGAGVASDTPAPAFDLPLLEGGRVTNADLAGRVAVINVWASWCPPCREEAPILRRVHAGADPERVAFLGVIRNDDEDDASDFARDHGLTYPNAIGDGAFASDFGVRGLPMTYVLDARGRIVARHFGAISESKLIALMDEAAARSEADAAGGPAGDS